MRPRDAWEAGIRAIVRDAAHTRDARDRWLERITGAIAGAAVVALAVYII